MLKCEICGKEIRESQYSNAVLCSGKCFIKHLWQGRIAHKKDYIVINGELYSDGGNVEHPTRYDFLGCAGRRFWIKFKDGKTLTTNNLWDGGKIPEEYRNELPDTAEFYFPHLKNENNRSDSF